MSIPKDEGPAADYAERLRARAGAYAERSPGEHQKYRGKIEMVPRCPVRGLEDFSIWYSPGVAAPCLEIRDRPELVYEYTSKWNTVAVVSDGSRVLGLGDIGAKAALPVMEGKALIYKVLGGVDSVPIVLDTRDPDELIRTVLLMQPTFGGINLEDLAQPKCFYILDTLRREAEIPVWHDDQQGTATVTLAGMINALKVTGRDIASARFAFIGVGAANVAGARLLFGYGADPQGCVFVDSRGILGPHRHDIEERQAEFPDKWRLCRTTNREGRTGGIAEALRGMDVVISLSTPGPGTIAPDAIRGMAKDPIVFACANPIPEIWPWEAKAAGAAVVATGRSDFDNQVNNSMVFPSIFRGTLDVRAKTISDEMCFAAADELAEAVAGGPTPERLLPTMEEWEVFPQVAAAVGVRAQEQGFAALTKTRDQLYHEARRRIERTRAMMTALSDGGFVVPDAAITEG